MSARGAEAILAQRRADGLTATGQPRPVPEKAPDTRPTRRENAVKGAAGGSAAGPEGAIGGGVLGALKPRGQRPRSTGSRALVVEFTICMLVLVLTPVAHGGGGTTSAKWMKKASATAFVFIVLGFLSTVGETPRKVATGLGALMTVTVLLNERSIFADLVRAVNGPGVAGPPVVSPSPLSSSGGSGPHGILDTLGLSVTTDPTLPIAAGGAAAGGLVGGPVGAGLGGVIGAGVGGFLSDLHVSDSNGNGLPPLQQRAIQNDPLVNFFKGLFG